MPIGDPMVLGISFQIVGIYFLAASIVFKKPRRVLEDLFGIKRGSLRQIRDAVYRKHQVVFGMVFLLAGYLIEIYGIARDKGGSGAFGRQSFLILVFLVLVILAVTAVINILGITWTHRSFKRLLVRFFQENPRMLQENRSLTKELGELMGVTGRGDMSFEEYSRLIRDHLNLRDAPSAASQRGGDRRTWPARSS